MVVAKVAIIAVPVELKVEFILLGRPATNCATGAETRRCPDTPWKAAG
jgi:hypothetical protein